MTNYICHPDLMNNHDTVFISRIVFNVHAEYEGTFPNNNLLFVIDFVNNLVNVITIFQTDNYAIICDIYKTFYQLKVYECDVTLYVLFGEK